MERDPLDLDVFHENGYVRKTCKKCGARFWTADKARETCGEFPCDPYIFIDRPLMKKKLDFYEMMDEFLHFFERNGHVIIDRYPVVARWRKDVFLVNASIYDFQPHVTSGQVPPPANPLVVPQPCIRMVDIDEVGKTGRHLTSFVMLGHHAFNYTDKKIYWKDETVAYCLKFLETLGIDKEMVTFKEKPWIGGGNGGFAVEVIVGGLELATLVFMDMKEDPKGSVEIEGLRFSPMSMKIVDTGYGLERFVWMSKAEPSVFDAIYGDFIDYLLDILKIKKPENYREIVKKFVTSMDKSSIDFNEEEWNFINLIRKIHIITDHTRTIVFMLNDGAVPSNSKAGYLSRLVLRRFFRIVEDLSLQDRINDIIDFQWRKFERMLDSEMHGTVMDMIKIEYERYRETKEKGRQIVERVIKKGKVDLDTLISLYDTYGVLPEMVQEIAGSHGINFEIPENFRSVVASRHERAQEEKEEEVEKIDLEKTYPLYYQDPYMKEFDAKVIYSNDGIIALDRTAFYPEGGGQPADHGYFIYNDMKINVKDVKKYGDVILHFVDSPVEIGSTVHGVIDWERRSRLMKNHTAAHILLYSARKVLGKHVWQAGAQKDVFLSRLDITHYKKIGENEIREIEREALKIIMENVPVQVEWMDRNDAEKKYGFKLYEGGIPPGEKIRVVKINDYDVEGCGGTHVSRTGEIGFIKIVKEERIQDGVSRLFFSSGIGALEIVQNYENILNDSSNILRVQPDDLPKTVERFFKEWKDLKKENDVLRETIIKLKIENLKPEKKIGNVPVFKIDADDEDIIKLAMIFEKENGILVAYGKNIGTIVDNSGKEILNLIELKGKINKNVFIGKLPEFEELIEKIGRIIK